MRTSSTAIIAVSTGNTDVRYVLEMRFLWRSQGRVQCLLCTSEYGIFIGRGNGRLLDEAYWSGLYLLIRP